MTATLARAGITCLERGWLSANNILIRGEGPTALVDSGYATHAEQTVALLRQSLGEVPLDLLLNTHLHSDHCGGNAALQRTYPDLVTHIPPGLAAAVADWDPVALTFEPTGQICPRFAYQRLLQPGASIRLGPMSWDIHAAKGHDPHSIVLFQPEHRLLISADALWENGFGVVFPELEGVSAFQEVAETLDLIEALAPVTVMPGHGRVFNDVDGALSRARSRLDQFVRHPDKHRRHALKVLVKFKLLEWQSVSEGALLDWALQTSYFAQTMPAEARVHRTTARQWLSELLRELERNQALLYEDGRVINR
ncbi:MBL fold metallo-hydrolase [Hydrogenophaga laconesensis]|uniref:Glyoxylase-like metal-dependent hydrolase (Beta-lactamase superfamily II) n=1 Tax=Hydrogenophaga laconesensis TaxID=1805971 RepID=A0ABU1VHU9_9BURK|nr:MBL fold metallo-hydrolase [Hydrogenophaga laconesensis]MDR7096900.1 glyoxylase-like metal-dependent hydrolase (beta-lactamase superfamily II) [Hydrogenophaga laconesensis]